MIDNWLDYWGGATHRYEGAVYPVLKFAGQIPGIHDNKPYDDCLRDCPGRLLEGSYAVYEGRLP